MSAILVFLGPLSESFAGLLLMRKDILVGVFWLAMALHIIRKRTNSGPILLRLCLFGRDPRFYLEVDGSDLGFIGGRFTWDNRQCGQALIRERIDRAVVNKEWIAKFPLSLVEHLVFEESDHCPILIRLGGQEKRVKKPFRFLKVLTTDRSSNYVIEKAWNADIRPGMNCHKLKISFQETTKALRIWNKEVFGFADKEIRNLEADLLLLQQREDRDMGKEAEVLDKLRVHRSRWESILRQKSRETWLKEGDKNTKFFHSSLLNRRRKNKIQAIKDDQRGLSNPDQIRQYFLNHFKELYKSDFPQIPEHFKELGERLISPEDNTALLRFPTPEEVKEAIWNLHPLKSPGPDGYPGIFFRSYWNIVQDKVVKFTQECFRLQRIPSSMNETFIVVIPKINQPQNFNHFRPISLCNFVYKIVSKILAGRLSNVIEKIISPHQGAFVKGRWIAENTVIAQELVHKIRKHKGKQSLMMIKIDLKKAYDRLEWSFVDKVLELWGFSSEFPWMIRSCLSSVHYSLLLNGSVSGTFQPERGIRQGDPLSPILFILCSEILSRLLLKEEDQDRLHGIKVDRNAPAISHLMYADDLIISCRANPRDATIIKECLSYFCSWSGQEVNEEKSNIFFSRSTPRKAKMAIKEILGFKDLGTSAIYLGNSLVFGRNKTKEFHILKERLKGRLEGWNRHFLSKVGKATLIKSVVQAIPSYTMSTFLLPVNVCEDMDAIVRKFWWESKPNATGIESKSPTTRVESDVSRWRRVFELRDERTNQWKETEIHPDSAEAILQIVWPRVSCSDKLIWKGNKEDQSRESEAIWKNLWNINMHERLKMFLWRVLSNVIPTRDLIFTRIGKGDRNCVWCEDKEETLLHISKDCHFIRRLAFASNWGCRLENWNVSNTKELVEMCINPITAGGCQAFNNDQAGIAFVAREWKGEVVYCDSKRIFCSSPLEAEVKALSLAAETAERNNWQDLCWSSDCREAVNTILSVDNPLVWETRHDIIFLRSLFKKENWCLSWNSRNANRVADLMAKKAL
nr:uncharacterized protein LOC125422764 [Ziziphus jujuba var. spinosa]